MNTTVRGNSGTLPKNGKLEVEKYKLNPLFGFVFCLTLNPYDLL